MRQRIINAYASIDEDTLIKVQQFFKNVFENVSKLMAIISNIYYNKIVWILNNRISIVLFLKYLITYQF